MNKKYDYENISDMMELSEFFHRAFQLATERAQLGKTSAVRYQILKSLARKDKQSLTDISYSLLAKKNALSQLLDRMVNDGLIDRVEDKNDRRKIILSLTEKGREVIQDFERALIENTHKMNSNVTEEEKNEFRQALKVMIEIVRKNSKKFDTIFAKHCGISKEN